MKKLLTILVGILLFTTTVSATDFQVDTSQLNQGVFKVNYQAKSAKPLKVLVEKDGLKYAYDYRDADRYPLQLGNGEYTIKVMEYVSGSTYKILRKTNIAVTLEDQDAVYLQSTQKTNYDDPTIKELAIQLTKDAASNAEKMKMLYDYIITTFAYDYEKAKALKPNGHFVPNNLTLIDNKKGICSDFASLYASMLRSLGIPAKLVTGYKNDIKEYHAWNVIYNAETKEWITVDTTYDIVQKSYKKAYTFRKNNTDYAIKNHY